MNERLLDRAMKLIKELKEEEDVQALIYHDHTLHMDLIQLENDYELMKRG